MKKICNNYKVELHLILKAETSKAPGCTMLIVFLKKQKKQKPFCFIEKSDPFKVQTRVPRLYDQAA